MLRNRIVLYDSTLLNAFKKMDALGKKLLIVLNKDKFYGLLSAGDIQRAIINNRTLDTKIYEVLRDNIRIANLSDSFNTIKQMMFDFRMELCPVVNEQKEILKIYFWEDVFGENKKRQQSTLNLPVVIMAGGKGTRLKPITNVIPKPLIPIGEKTIIEEIMDRFVNVGCGVFFLSVNYKAETIKHYFKQLDNEKYSIIYFQEDEPLGTAGSLFLIKDKIKTTFFVSNCDIIIDEDYAEILKYHKENYNTITVVSVLKHYKIPYGTIETGEKGLMKTLSEKPELTFQINSGLYILEPELLSEISENSFFHITDLIENVKNSGRNVGVFPVSEGSWKDIGEWDEYLKQIRDE